LDISIKKDRNTLIWIRFDAFAKQLINNSHSQEIYVTYVKFITTGKQCFCLFFLFISILQRLMVSMEDKYKVNYLNFYSYKKTVFFFVKYEFFRFDLNINT
jgi:hypothetical protein